MVGHPLLQRAAAVCLVVWGTTSCNRSTSADPTPGDSAPVVRVRAVTAVDRPEVTTASGAVEAIHTADLGFQVGGRAALVVPEEGASVPAGGMLAQLDSTDFRLGLELAEAAAARALDEVTRLRQLAARGSAAPADLVRSETAYRVAEAQRRVAVKRLADATLTAPFAGVVARRAVNPGEMVAAGVPVFTVVDLSMVQVRAGVPEADIGAIRIGQAATVVVPALGEREFRGRVSLVGVAADPVSRSYVVKARIANGERLLRPGMIAEIRVVGTRRVQALTVPGEALVHQADGTTLVFVLPEGDTRVRARPVQLGRVLDRDVEVISGLKGGDMVVIAGQHRLADGDLVQVQGGDRAPTAAPR